MKNRQTNVSKFTYDAKGIARHPINDLNFSASIGYYLGNGYLQ